ncbi:hypothetical protein M378DRAFT_1023477 [Amanita muscaria Koide BX008]|uniref:Uncharacterized protein n=1 Tax=Amanita muscaria (strain Koide BX008) TaxID=946122 RepID=A0A0C2S8D6_AMAMK|nr:hypothetical protein M378DRAFT_1023477 [Amanita muscaria Koide BX008]
MSIHDEDVKPFIAMARCGPSLYYNKRLVIYPFTVASEPPEHLEGSVISLMSTLGKKHKTDTICAVKGCWRVKLAKHVRLLDLRCDLLANTAREGCLQYLLACCKLGHDIHAQIPQIEDSLPNFPKGYLEIPFERDERDPADKRGVPLLEILFKWKNIRDHDKLPDQFLALTKSGFLLRFLVRRVYSIVWWIERDILKF